MSLINQMLRDLEGRKRDDAGDPAEISVPGISARRRSGLVTWLIVATALLVAAGIGLWFGQRLGPGNGASSGRVATQASSPVATRAEPSPARHGPTAKHATPTVAAPSAAEPATRTAPGPALAAVRLLHENGRDGLELRLSAPAEANLFELQNPPRWILELEGVSDVPANLGAAALPPEVRSLHYGVEGGKLRLVFTVANAIPAEKQVVSATQIKLWFGTATKAPAVAVTARAPAAPVVKADVPKPRPTVSADTSEMVKVPRKPTPREQAEQDYQDALRATRAGELSIASQALKHALRGDAGYAPARQLLAQIYLHQGRKSDAVTLLQQGLALDGNDSDRARLSDLYARILADDGKLDQAIALLQAARPTVAEAPDHYALLAALDQRAGDYQAAATIYNRLVELRPDSGVWWMGLGISLEHLGKPEDAVMAYRRAASAGSLDPTVQKFVDGRIAALSQ